MSVKYCNSENEFHIPLLGGDKGGGSIKKDIHLSDLQYFTNSLNKKTLNKFIKN